MTQQARAGRRSLRRLSGRPGSSARERYEFCGAAFWGFLALCVVVLVGGLLATVLLREHTWAWLVPVLGLALVLVAFFVANVLINVAMLKRP